MNNFNTEESVVIEELSEQELEQVVGGCETCAADQALARQWANRNNYMNVPAGWNNGGTGYGGFGF